MDSSRRAGETHSGFKILIEQGSDRILGAHLLGPHAEEVINIFSMAIRLGLTVKDLNDPILYAYRTYYLRCNLYAIDSFPIGIFEILTYK